MKTGAIFFSAFAIIILSALGYAIYLDVTAEYKYTAIIPCYDRYGSEIINTSCKKDVTCGSGQNYDNDDWKSYPCDENKYDGKFAFEVKDE